MMKSLLVKPKKHPPGSDQRQGSKWDGAFGNDHHASSKLQGKNDGWYGRHQASLCGCCKACQSDRKRDKWCYSRWITSCNEIIGTIVYEEDKERNKGGGIQKERGDWVTRTRGDLWWRIREGKGREPRVINSTPSFEQKEADYWVACIGNLVIILSFLGANTPRECCSGPRWSLRELHSFGNNFVWREGMNQKWLREGRKYFPELSQIYAHLGLESLSSDGSEKELSNSDLSHSTLGEDTLEEAKRIEVDLLMGK